MSYLRKSGQYAVADFSIFKSPTQAMLIYFWIFTWQTLNLPPVQTWIWTLVRPMLSPMHLILIKLTCEANNLHALLPRLCTCFLVYVLNAIYAYFKQFFLIVQVHMIETFRICLFSSQCHDLSSIFCNTPVDSWIAKGPQAGSETNRWNSVAPHLPPLIRWCIKRKIFASFAPNILFELLWATAK